jgi:hypothetical protein
MQVDVCAAGKDERLKEAQRNEVCLSCSSSPQERLSKQEDLPAGLTVSSIDKAMHSHTPNTAFITGLSHLYQTPHY